MLNLIAILTVLTHQGSSSTALAPSDLVHMVERYCVSPDGDQPLTWALAESDGFAALTPAEFENLRLPGARNLRGYEAVRDGVRLRVLTANNRFRGWDAGTTFFNLCWVSAEPLDRRALDAEVRRWLGFSGFRQEGARVYAWVPLPDGTQRVVGPREFERRFHGIAREEGMRMILTNDRLGMVQ